MFVITCHESRFGFTVRASEEGADHFGFQFAAFSETCPYSALGDVRKKAHRSMATRHITGRRGNCNMLHDEVRGRITADDDGNVVLVVDGIPLSIGDLESLLGTHEGWEFRLKIVDALE